MNVVPLHACNDGEGAVPLTGAGNWTWLIPGRVPTLIDAGVGLPRHLDALESALRGVRLANVLVTHGHSDHASGAAAVAVRMPEVRFLKMPWPERDHRWPVSWERIGDGDRIEAGEGALTAIHTPGHAPDHLCFWDARSRTLFGGDLLIDGSSVSIPATRGGDLGAYLASLERVLALDPVRVLPAHGRVIDRPAVLLRASIARRRERERQILELLAPGAIDLDAIVTRLYAGLRESLVPHARDTVLAHLLKLERERRAARDGEAWHIMEP
ncbi:MAG: hypothetical protein A3F70_16220 [Acidobacteria bacterium RIFCSPLOWO2_12_FULL_67_14]|nr:MAG: hypothetical protein A3H29_06895 [Acidobacteria bacterium RIFCSPLOWO2_02_FULL_67_21]OFW35445.1 MAG: hypothetical protein A3F70_16220 [Acidobacteria bacterium RIFCSPLOWO2_12_FULL_67_14]